MFTNFIIKEEQLQDFRKSPEETPNFGVKNFE
jgi:hypothetical protein